MEISGAMSNRRRPSPDWLGATIPRNPAWLSREIASRLPGIGRHSSGDLMNWSLSWLITPSRWSTSKRAARVETTDSAANWTIGRRGGAAERSGGELGDVGHAIHRRRHAR